MLLELFIGVVTFVLAWEFLFKYRRNQILKQNGIPGPPNLPLVGSAHYLARESPQTIFDLQARFLKKYGKTFRMWIMHELAILTADPHQIEAILSSQKVISKNTFYDLLEEWLGRGLLMSTGKKWHTRRKIITPTFHFKILEQFVEVFDQQSAIMVEKLYQHADGKTIVNIFPIVCLTALDIITETAMGVKVNAQRNPNFPYVNSVTSVAEITAKRFMSLNERYDWSLKYTAPLTYYKLNQHIKLMHDFTNNVIEERRVALEKTIANGSLSNMEDEVDDLGKKKRMAFLDVLLQSTVDSKPLSNNDIREEVDTFMFEGHDTTTSSISHTLYLLSRYPEIQRKVVNEIKDVIGEDKSKPIEMRELQDLKYLECVIKESLRLYPSVPIIGRITEEEIVLNGITYPKNTNIVIMFYHAMRDPEYFPEPLKFKPERFSADSNVRIDPFAYTPFSAGPRNCIGQKFAMLEMKSTISKVLRHFELLPLGEEVQPLLNIILRSATGTQLGLRPRKSL